jgi:hypothetical protein
MKDDHHETSEMWMLSLIVWLVVGVRVVVIVTWEFSLIFQEQKKMKYPENNLSILYILIF